MLRHRFISMTIAMTVVMAVMIRNQKAKISAISRLGQNGIRR